MNPGGEETDALLRQLRGYARLWRDPPVQQGSTLEETKDRAAGVFLSAFADLDERLSKGELPPEEWDESMGFEPRHRVWGPGGYAFIYPPGVTGPAPCTLRTTDKGCEWLNPGADNTCCARCHTIRIRKHGSSKRDI